MVFSRHCYEGESARFGALRRFTNQNNTLEVESTMFDAQ
jgi:hypothetical protein